MASAELSEYVSPATTIPVSNNNIQQRAGLAGDSDGDSVPDLIDVDDDNDTIPDVVEVGNDDVNFDGLYDFFLDLNNDGLADRLWTSPIVPRDSDQDGIEDFRDLDSDEDGLSDRIETFGVDTDGNGLVDNLVDANIDGLDDGYLSRAMQLPDTDNDSFPDYRDIDSDGDGITDSEEAFGISNPVTGTNSSTAFKPLLDAQNEEMTLQTGQNGSVFGCTLRYDENTRIPIDPVFLLLVGVSVMILFRRRSGLAPLLTARVLRRRLALPGIVSIALLTSCATFLPSNPAGTTKERQPYAGFGIGVSFLDADTSNLSFSQENTSSVAGQLTLGLSLDRRLSFEARAADLGEANFTSGGAVGYQVAGISGLYKHHFAKFSGFARMGLGALFNDGDIRAEQKNKVHLLVGLGAQYDLSSRIALRAEWQGHDVDVMHSQFSVLYRFGANTKSANAVLIGSKDAENSGRETLVDADFNTVPDKSIDDEQIASAEANEQNPSTSKAPKTDSYKTKSSTTKPVTPKVQPEPKPKPEPAVKAEAAVSKPTIEASVQAGAAATGNSDDTPSSATSDEKLAQLLPNDTPTASEPLNTSVSTTDQPDKTTASADADNSGIDNASDQCLGTKTGQPVLEDSCSMFDELVVGLTFVTGTDRLTEPGEDILNDVADGLAKEPEVRVTVAVHTAPTTDANAAMFLTRRRTIAIIRYLSDKGIDTTRLRPEAYGDTQPLAGAQKPSDNDRVVLSTR